MSTYGILGRFSEFNSLRAEPIWALLGAEKAPAIASCLHALFMDGQERQLPASAVHERLSRHLSVLQSAGVDIPKPAQAYVLDWLSLGWLRREFPDGSSEEQFELTADAAEALRYLMRLSKPRTVATESRLASVVQLLQALAEATDDNPETRLATLTAERERINEEMAAVRAGRFVPLAAERAVERAREVISQGEELLGDFDKVRERFGQINLQLRKDLVENDGGRGEVLSKIFDGIDVIKQTDAGKVFDAFWRLLIDPIASARFEEALLQVVSRPFSSTLDAAERRILTRLKSRLIDQAAGVHTVQASFASGLQSFVRSREFAEQRRIARLLKQAQQVALTCSESIRINQRLDFHLVRTSAAIRSASQWSLHDPLDHVADPTMDVVTASDVRLEDIQDLVHRSEIDMRSLKKNLRAALLDQRQVTIGGVLERFPAEQGLGTVVGYLQLATRFAVPSEEREVLRWQGGDNLWRRADAPLFYFMQERIDEFAD